MHIFHAINIMTVVITTISLFIGCELSVIINKISNDIYSGRKSTYSKASFFDINRGIRHIIYSFKEGIFSKNTLMSFVIIIISTVVFLISFQRIGLNLLFLKAVVLGSILIIVSFIDLEHKIIPNSIVFITLVLGIIFSFVGDISFTSSIMGMIAGGGILFLLALIPGVIGGGDIKFMFAIGSFLGLNKTLWALFLAFVSAAIISLLLLIFRIKGRKDYIPFGPFLSLGSFISFWIFI